MDASVSLVQRMPYTTAFPKALGTGLLVSTARPVSTDLRAKMKRLIDGYEHALSRFRADSLVTRIGNAEHGGHFDFPDWTGPLFDLYDALHDVTRGAIDPCVGEDLIRLGYDPTLSFTVETDAVERLGALHGRPVWGHDVVRSDDTTLVTHGSVHLDFGACGKGYLVDLLGGLLGGLEPSCVPREPHPQHAMRKDSAHTAGATDFNRENTFPEFVIDAGGDLLVHTSSPIRVALEDPDDSSRAVGVAEICDGALCASAPSRRHWEVAVDERTHLAIHHLLNAIDGLPAQQAEASWTYVPSSSQYLNNSYDTANAAEPANATLSLAQNYPTAVADGLATALFVSDAAQLQSTFNFACATLNESRQIAASNDFPAELFLQSVSRPHTSPNLKSKAAF